MAEMLPPTGIPEDGVDPVQALIRARLQRLGMSVPEVPQAEPLSPTQMLFSAPPGSGLDRVGGGVDTFGPSRIDATQLGRDFEEEAGDRNEARGLRRDGSEEPGWLEDKALWAGGAFNRGLGATIESVGQGVRAAGQMSADIMSPLTGSHEAPITDAIADGVEALGRGMKGFGDQGLSQRQRVNRESVEAIHFSGNLADPSSWDVEGLSLRGALNLTGQIFGEMLPIFMGGMYSRAAGIAVGTGQTASYMAEEAEGAIREMVANGHIEASPRYQELTSSGLSPSDAVERMVKDTRNLATLWALPIGMMGTAVTLRALKGELGGVGRSIALEAGEEAFQENSESYGSQLSAELISGLDRELGQNSFENTVLGGTMGTLFGLGGAIGHRSGHNQGPALAQQDPTQLAATGNGSVTPGMTARQQAMDQGQVLSQGEEMAATGQITTPTMATGATMGDADVMTAIPEGGPAMAGPQQGAAGGTVQGTMSGDYDSHAFVPNGPAGDAVAAPEADDLEAEKYQMPDWMQAIFPEDRPAPIRGQEAPSEEELDQQNGEVEGSGALDPRIAQAETATDYSDPANPRQQLISPTREVTEADVMTPEEEAAARKAASDNEGAAGIRRAIQAADRDLQAGKGRSMAAFLSRPGAIPEDNLDPARAKAALVNFFRTVSNSFKAMTSQFGEVEGESSPEAVRNTEMRKRLERTFTRYDRIASGLQEVLSRSRVLKDDTVEGARAEHLLGFFKPENNGVLPFADELNERALNDSPADFVAYLEAKTAEMAAKLPAEIDSGVDQSKQPSVRDKVSPAEYLRLQDEGRRPVHTSVGKALTRTPSDIGKNPYTGEDFVAELPPAAQEHVKARRATLRKEMERDQNIQSFGNPDPENNRVLKEEPPKPRTAEQEKALEQDRAVVKSLEASLRMAQRRRDNMARVLKPNNKLAKEAAVEVESLERQLDEAKGRVQKAEAESSPYVQSGPVRVTDAKTGETREALAVEKDPLHGQVRAGWNDRSQESGKTKSRRERAQERLERIRIHQGRDPKVLTDDQQQIYQAQLKRQDAAKAKQKAEKSEVDLARAQTIAKHFGLNWEAGERANAKQVALYDKLEAEDTLEAHRITGEVKDHIDTMREKLAALEERLPDALARRDEALAFIGPPTDAMRRAKGNAVEAARAIESQIDFLRQAITNDLKAQREAKKEIRAVNTEAGASGTKFSEQKRYATPLFKKMKTLTKHVRELAAANSREEFRKAWDSLIKQAEVWDRERVEVYKKVKAKHDAEAEGKNAQWRKANPGPELPVALADRLRQQGQKYNLNDKLGWMQAQKAWQAFLGAAANAAQNTDTYRPERGEWMDISRLSAEGVRLTEVMGEKTMHFVANAVPRAIYDPIRNTVSRAKPIADDKLMDSRSAKGQKAYRPIDLVQGYSTETLAANTRLIDPRDMDDAVNAALAAGVDYRSARFMAEWSIAFAKDNRTPKEAGKTSGTPGAERARRAKAEGRGSEGPVDSGMSANTIIVSQPVMHVQNGTLTPVVEDLPTEDTPAIGGSQDIVHEGTGSAPVVGTVVATPEELQAIADLLGTVVTDGPTMLNTLDMAVDDLASQIKTLTELVATLEAQRDEKFEEIDNEVLPEAMDPELATIVGLPSEGSERLAISAADRSVVFVATHPDVDHAVDKLANEYPKDDLQATLKQIYDNNTERHRQKLRDLQERHKTLTAARPKAQVRDANEPSEVVLRVSRATTAAANAALGENVPPFADPADWSDLLVPEQKPVVDRFGHISGPQAPSTEHLNYVAASGQLSDTQLRGAALMVRAWTNRLRLIAERGEGNVEDAGFLLMDGTGLGKTRQLLAFIYNVVMEEKASGRNRTVLLSTPGVDATFLNQWASEAAKIGVLDALFEPTGIKEMPYRFKSDLVHFRPHVKLTGLGPDKDKQWAAIVADEVHERFMNDQKTMGKYFAELHAPLRVFSSATPTDQQGQEQYWLRWMQRGEHAVDIDTAMLKASRSVNTSDYEASMQRVVEDLVARGLVVSRQLETQAKFEVHELKTSAKSQEFSPDGRALAYLEAHPNSSADVRKFITEHLKVRPMVVKAVADILAGKQVVAVFSYSNPNRSISDKVLQEPPIARFVAELKQELASRGISPKVVADYYGSQPSDAGVTAFKAGQARVLAISDTQGGTGISLDDSNGPLAPREMYIAGTVNWGARFIQVLGRIDRAGTRTRPRITYVAVDPAIDPTDANFRRDIVKKLRINDAVSGKTSARAAGHDTARYAEFQDLAAFAGTPGNVNASLAGVNAWSHDIDREREGLTRTKADRAFLKLFERGETDPHAFMDAIINSGDKLLAPLAKFLKGINPPGMTVVSDLRDLVIGMASEAIELGEVTPDEGADWAQQMITHAGGINARGMEGRTNRIGINPDVAKGRGVARVFLHEWVHALTAHYLDGNQAAQAQLQMIMARLQQHLPEAMERDHKYAMSNPFEFVAEVFSGNRLTEVLKSLPAYEKSGLRSMWEEFTNWVRKLLRLPPHIGRTVFDEVVDLAGLKLAATQRANHAAVKDWKNTTSRVNMFGMDSTSSQALSVALATTRDGRGRDVRATALKGLLKLKTLEQMVDDFVKFTKLGQREAGRLLQAVRTAIQEKAASVARFQREYDKKVIEPYDAWRRAHGNDMVSIAIEPGKEPVPMTRHALMGYLMNVSGYARVHFGLAKTDEANAVLGFARADAGVSKATIQRSRQYWDHWKPLFDEHLGKEGQKLYSELASFFESRNQWTAQVQTGFYLDEMSPLSSGSWMSKSRDEQLAAIEELEGRTDEKTEKMKQLQAAMRAEEAAKASGALRAARRQALQDPDVVRLSKELSALEKANGGVEDVRELRRKLREAKHRALQADEITRLEGEVKKAKIRAEEAEEEARAKNHLKTLKEILKTGRVRGAYFPLRRFGDVVVQISHEEAFNSDEQMQNLLAQWPGSMVTTPRSGPNKGRRVVQFKSVSRFESFADAQTYYDQVKANYPAGWAKPPARAFDSLWRSQTSQVNMALVNRMNRRLETAGVPDHMRDALLKQFSLAMLDLSPETSLASSMRERMGVEGAALDPVRSLSQYGAASARYQAAMLHSRQLTDAVGSLKKHAESVQSLPASDGVDHLNAIVDSLDERMAKVEEGMSLGKLQVASDMGFMYHLVGVSYNMLNMLQNAMITYPELAARHGHAAAIGALSRSARQAFGSTLGRNSRMWATGYSLKELGPLFKLWGTRADFNTVENYSAADDALAALKNPNHANLLRHMIEHNQIDVSQGMDMASRGGRAHADISGRPLDQSKWGYLTDWMRMAPHAVEVFNRVTAATAAFDLEFAKNGGDFNGARDYAIRVVEQTHFVYMNENKPPVLMSKAPRLMFMFMQHTQHMYHYMFQRAIAGVLRRGEMTPEQKNEALKAFATFVAMHLLVAGAAGGTPEFLKPIAYLGYVVLPKDWVGDEPFNWDVMVANAMVDMFGENRFSDAMTHGALAAIGIDISGRVGINQMLFFESPDFSTREQTMKSLFTLSTGAMGGMMLNVNDARAAMMEGDFYSAIQKASPKVLRDFMGAYADYDGGYRDGYGRLIAGGGVPTIGSTVAQAMGFRPLAKTEQQMARSVAEDNRTMMDRRSQFYEDAFRAVSQGKGIGDMIPDIRRWNELNPDRPIRFKDLLASINENRRRERQGVHGVSGPRAQQPWLAHRTRFAGE